MPGLILFQSYQGEQLKGLGLGYELCCDSEQNDVNDIQIPIRTQYRIIS